MVKNYIYKWTKGSHKKKEEEEEEEEEESYFLVW